MRNPTLALVLLATLGLTTQVRSAETVRFAYAVQVHQASMMIIQDFAKKYGVTLEVVPMRRYADLQLALMTNQVDIAVMGYVNLGLMREKNFEDYRAIAGVFNGGQSLTLAKGVEAKTWKDLEGKTLGTAPNSYAELLFKTSATLGGADISKIKTVSFAAGGPPMLSALKSHEIDGFVSWEPNNADAAISGDGYYSPLDIGDNPTKHINGVLTVNLKFLKEHRAAVLDVVKALVDATNELNNNAAKYQEIAVRGTGSSPATVREAIPHGTLDYKLHYNEAKALLQLIAQAKMTQTDTSASVDSQFDYSLLSEATGLPKSQLGGQ
jgi:ABC-type nitrate/sulfonate/bicarbonate transport system substrate-binding protein